MLQATIGLTDPLLWNFISDLILWSIKNLNVNLQSKCGVGFICQQKSNICSFQQTNLWQSLTSKLIWAAICNIRAENFNFTLDIRGKIYQQNTVCSNQSGLRNVAAVTLFWNFWWLRGLLCGPKTLILGQKHAQINCEKEELQDMVNWGGFQNFFASSWADFFP